MSILCRLLGHKPSRQVQLNPSTFVAHGFCKRCRLPLVRNNDGVWQPPSELPEPRD